MRAKHTAQLWLRVATFHDMTNIPASNVSDAPRAAAIDIVDGWPLFFAVSEDGLGETELVRIVETPAVPKIIGPKAYACVQFVNRGDIRIRPGCASSKFFSKVSIVPGPYVGNCESSAKAESPNNTPKNELRIGNDPTPLT